MTSSGSVNLAAVDSSIVLVVCYSVLRVLVCIIYTRNIMLTEHARISALYII